MSEIAFDNRVAIVTGAGTGLGRSHALALAARGVKVVVNDLGGSVDGKVDSRLKGASDSPGNNTSQSQSAESVVAEIEAAGGEAIANRANVTLYDEVEDMVQIAIKKWGHVDILVNNAGILRDKSFSKMPLEDFKSVLEVHLMGAVHCCKAVWEHMKARHYGRIVMTSSSSGLYGNFGQANYGAAKAGIVGLMNVLHLEGASKNIRINMLSPTAATRMTQALLPPEALAVMTTQSVSAGLIYLCCDGAPSRLILCAGAGGYAATRIYETQGIHLAPDGQTPENIAERIADILDPAGQEIFEQGAQQTMKFVRHALAGKASA